jgi:hypothetical protein
MCTGTEAGFTEPDADAFTGFALFQVSRSTWSLASVIHQAPTTSPPNDYSTFNPAIITHWNSVPFLWTCLLVGFVLMVMIALCCLRYGTLIALFLGMDSRVEQRRSGQRLSRAASSTVSEGDEGDMAGSRSFKAGCFVVTRGASREHVAGGDEDVTGGDEDVTGGDEDVAGSVSAASLSADDRTRSTHSVTFADAVEEVEGTAASSQALSRSDPSGSTVDDVPSPTSDDVPSPTSSAGFPLHIGKSKTEPVRGRKAGRRVTLTRVLPPVEDGESSGGSSADLDWHPLRSMGLSQVLMPSENPNKDEDIREYIEKQNSSWQLFFRAMGAIAQVWGVLAFMYWSLLTNQGELMDCLAHPHGRFVGHLCTYTHACLRGFPILAVNVTLVSMIRMLIQTRMYYSLLQRGYVLDFADTGIMYTQWPVVFGLSMLQGGVHLLLKMYYEPNPDTTFIELARKFVVPGTIFLSFFLRYAEIENTLLPLNRIAERDYNKDDRTLKFTSKLQAMNERVIAFDARKRDVIGDVGEDLGRAPKLDDIFASLIETYDEAAERFYSAKRHYRWGLFRSLWPASLLVDRRLDFQDPKTRSWMLAIMTYFSICSVVAVGSTCFFVASIYRNFHMGWLHQNTSPEDYTVTETLLANAVLMIHAFLLIFFFHRAIRGMFYFEIHTGVIEIDLI